MPKKIQTKPKPAARETVSRKQRHVEICLDDDVNFTAKTNGFERFAFTHNAVPEINFDELELSTTFLGKKIAYPFMISSMTGGYAGATQVNQILAKAAQALNIPLGVGSMRQALETSAHRDSFTVVRDLAPNVPIYANIGAAEVARGLRKGELEILINTFQADALIVHLNAAQELFQPEGDTNFAGFLNALQRLCSILPIPVIAKEVGNGISQEVAKKLAYVGVEAIDVAGSGGTNWQKVEAQRYTEKFSHDDRFTPGGLSELLEWGIPTAECLWEIGNHNTASKNPKSKNPKANAAKTGTAEKKTASKFIPLKDDELKRVALKDVELIASGGITNGIEIAKSIAMGASLAASAKPLLQAAFQPDGVNAVKKTIMQLMNDLRAVMFLVGAKSIADLRHIPIHRLP
jgi:isopentenyl-diphosphate Delta-isomerase